MKPLIIDDLGYDILPGGAAEPVLHVPAILFVISVMFPASPAY